jgi:hypothetical protein
MHGEHSYRYFRWSDNHHLTEHEYEQQSAFELHSSEPRLHPPRTLARASPESDWALAGRSRVKSIRTDPDPNAILTPPSIDDRSFDSVSDTRLHCQSGRDDRCARVEDPMLGLLKRDLQSGHVRERSLRIRFSVRHAKLRGRPRSYSEREVRRRPRSHVLPTTNPGPATDIIRRALPRGLRQPHSLASSSSTTARQIVMVA